MVIRDVLKPEELSRLGYDDFEAVFVLFHNYFSMNESVLWSVMPMCRKLFWLKPTFLETSFTRRFMNYVNILDGVAESPLDDTVTRKIEEIEQTIKDSGVNRTMVRDTEMDFIINQCRYSLSRGVYVTTNNSIGMFSEGDMQLIYNLFGENFFSDITTRLHVSMLDLGYIRPKRKMERIHICPSCGCSHLFFVEACPTCDSSDIGMEPVIHHFRCANISPESTYMFDGTLRCPKCKRTLRHIGIDYDIPTSLYTCNNCGRHFASPKMRVTCARCHKRFSPEELQPYTIEEYEYTEEGRKAIVSGYMKLNLSKPMLTGYSTYDVFKEIFYRLNRMLLNHDDMIVSILRIKISESNVENVVIKDWGPNIQQMMIDLPMCKFSTYKGWIYVMEMIPKKNYDAVIENTEKRVRENMESNKMLQLESNHFIYKQGDNMTEFLKKVGAD